MTLSHQFQHYLFPKYQPVSHFGFESQFDQNRNGSLLRLTTRPHAEQFEKWNLIHCRNRHISLCCNVPSSILFNSICCSSCGAVFPNQGLTKNCWGIHDNSWNKIITILNYCKKFRMPLERS